MTSPSGGCAVPLLTMTGRAQEQVAPYMAVGLSTAVHGIGSRPDMERNLQNWAHPHFNNLYIVCPNVGPVYVQSPEETDWEQVKSRFRH